MYMNEQRFIKIFELAGGAEAASKHCASDVNVMIGFAKGLNAAMEILNAKSDENAEEIAAAYRRAMASITGTNQDNWTVGDLTPDKNWNVK